MTAGVSIGGWTATRPTLFWTPILCLLVFRSGNKRKDPASPCGSSRGSASPSGFSWNKVFYVCLLFSAMGSAGEHWAGWKRKAEIWPLVVGGCSTAWMDRASSGLQLERGGATGKICAAAFYPSWEEVRVKLKREKKRRGKWARGKTVFLGGDGKVVCHGGRGWGPQLQRLHEEPGRQVQQQWVRFPLLLLLLLWHCCHISDGFVVTPLGRRLMRNWFR